LLFRVLFAVIEFGRALFVMNTLTEAARRGARMAAVCTVGDAKAASVAVFDNGDGQGAVVYDLTTANVIIEHLKRYRSTLPCTNLLCTLLRD
jgi:hypothetical protein